MKPVLIEGRRVDLDPSAVLGVGGEATVYRHCDLAVKIYHCPSKGDAVAEKQRAAKLDKIAAFPTNLPAAVVAPKAMVHDLRHRPIGYAMPAVTGAFEIAQLMKRRAREGVISNERVMRIFASLAAALDALHALGMVVGDLNDGNVLVVGDEIRFIDVDSMQFGRWPCPVAHERYLAPELYGVDLSAAPRFLPEHDWYAFLVLLFSALLYVHPFGGVHPKLPTLVRRVAAGVSLLSSLVKRPKAAADPVVLSDELRAVFSDCFDGGARGAFDRRILQTGWTKCRCGLEHARPQCPTCGSKGYVAPPRAADRHHGRCVVTRILSTEGRIVAAAVQGTLRWLVEENGRFVREDGATFDLRVGPRTRFGLQSTATWVGEGEQLLRFEGARSVAYTKTFDGESAFATSAAGCVRIEEDLLVDHEGRRIGPVVGGTTWVAMGRTLGFGFYRVGGVTKFFVFRPGRAGLTYVDLAAIDGRVRTAEAVFDDDTAVVSLVTERDGRSTSRLHSIAADGRVMGTLAGALDEHRVLASPRGRCVVGGRILTATEDGLVLLDVQNGALVERTCFVDSEPFVSAESLVLPAHGGAVYVVGAKTIELLTLT